VRYDNDNKIIEMLIRLYVLSLTLQFQERFLLITFLNLLLEMTN